MIKKWLVLGGISFSVGLSISLVINRNLKQAVLTGSLSVPATIAGVLVVERQTKQKFDELNLAQRKKLQNLEKKLQDLDSQEKRLTDSIAHQNHQVDSLKQEANSIEIAISTLNTDKQRCLQLTTQSQSKLDSLQNQIELFEQRQENLRLEITALESQLQQLQEAKLALEENISNLEQQNQRLSQRTSKEQNLLDRLQQQKSALEMAIAKVSTDREKLERELDEQQQQLLKLENNRKQVKDDFVRQQEELALLEKQVSIQKIEQQEFDNKLTQLKTTFEDFKREKQYAELDFVWLQIESSQNEKLIKVLEDELSALENTKQNLILEIERLRKIIYKPLEAETIISISDKYNDCNLDNSQYVKELWERGIFAYWNHKDRPDGYKFLGNVDIESQQSDRLLNIVGENLRKLDCVTENSLQQSFFELEQNWIKILTFALSEYAYYDSQENEGFWQGFCERINIEHSQTVEKTLRQVTERGVELLGLVRAKDGYKYVSTLWLQSGVPKQNIDHFATIVRDVADEYGWWELSHSSAEDIADELKRCWENKYKGQWGTVGHFLNVNSSDEDIEPVSGQLVKSIAVVARELERQDISPETLQNREVKEELLSSINLSYSFFLRDWSDLVTVLSPHEGNSDRSITKQRNQSPYLYLDIVDTLNIQLILPEQSLWKSQWQNLRGTYCLIPEANWEHTIPIQGNIEIPELEINIRQAANQWNCHLKNHYHNEIYEWKIKGVSSEFTCLVFNALSGEHLQINISEPKIIGVEEIICFTPRETQIELKSNIEIIDDFVPSSIKGWCGKAIRLVGSKASIKVLNTTIIWQLREDKKPQLVGLRLKGRKANYLDAPKLYYPPQKQEVIVNYLIESVDCKTTIAKGSLVIFANNNWSEIDLSQWITEAGNYIAEFWHEEKTWTYRFVVQKNYQVSEQQGYRNLNICDEHNNTLPIPAKYDSIDSFWSEEIKIHSLYPLEEVYFKLKSDREEYDFQEQADSFGRLILSLASLYDRLPPSNYYSLDVKQSGSEFKRLLQTGYSVSWRLTATEVIFEGYLPKDNYYLSGWNLLIPNKKSETINLRFSDSEVTTVALSFSPGIYQIQLCRENQLIENIGLWCGIEPQNIPEEITNNEFLANYCYTILGNETLEEFTNAIQQLNINFDLVRIQAILENLRDENYYLPEWLDKKGLWSKIQKILETLLNSQSVSSTKQKVNLENMKTTDSIPTISGQWCLVTVRQWRREAFLKYLNNDIERNRLQEIILEVIELQESVYQDMILIRISNFSEAKTHLQQIEHFQSIQRLKPNEVERMLNR